MANDINVVVLVGRLTRDCELKSTQSGTSVCRFSVAVNKRRKVQDSWTDEVNYFDIVLWGKTAETLKPYLVKGRQVSIEGELRQNRWEQEGQTRSKIEVVANNVQLLSSSNAQGTSSGNAPVTSVPAQDVGPEAFEDSDIPF